MIKARKFTQPMDHTGLPNTGSWAGYEYLQWTGSVLHPGLDYNWGAGEQDKGKPVYAIASGLVEKVLYWNGTTKGFGNHIFIKHLLESTGEVLYSHYCHLDTITCKENQEVSVGQKIGTCGGSGGWPSHLHLELRKPIGKGYNFWPTGYTAEWIMNNYYDPYQFIKEHNGGSMSDKMEIDKQTFENLVTKSGRWDNLIKYLTIDKDPLVTQLDDVRSIIAGYKSRETDLMKQLTETKKKLENRVEQVSRLKDQLLEEQKLRKALTDKLNEALKKSTDLPALYEGRINELQGQVDTLASEKGQLNIKIGLLEVEIQQLKKNQPTLTLADIVKSIWERIRNIKFNKDAKEKTS